MREALIILYLIACVAAGAIADGLNEKGKTMWGHPVEALSLALILIGPFIFFREIDFGLGILWLISYTSWRIVLFDMIHNLVKGQPILYLGDSNIWDRFFKKQLPQGVIWMRLIFLIPAISIPFNYF